MGGKKWKYGKKSREKNYKGRKGRKTIEKVKKKRGKGSEIAVKLSKKRKLYKYKWKGFQAHLTSLQRLLVTAMHSA